MPFSGSGTGIQHADDVFFSSVSDGDTLLYNSGTAKWNNGTIANTGSIFLNVKDYGAVGDGTADDTTAIQNALDAITADGGSVFIPAGRYKITSTLLISNHNTVVFGEGPGARQDSSQDARGTRLEAGGTLSGEPMLRTQLPSNTEPVHGCILRDISLDGMGVATGAGIHWRSHRSLMTHVFVYRFGTHGVHAHGYPAWDLYDSLFEFVQVSQCGGSGFYWDDGATDLHIDHCVLFDNLDNFQLFDGGSVQVTSTHFYNATRHNIFFNGAGSRSKFVNCKIEGAGQNGINIDSTISGYSDLTFSNCNITSNCDSADNVYDAVILQGPSSNGITRTTFTGCNFSTKSAQLSTRPRYFINLDGSEAQGTVISGCNFGPATHYGTAAIRNNGSSTTPARITGNGGGVADDPSTLTDAPIDGTQYARKDGAWDAVTTAAHASTHADGGSDELDLAALASGAASSGYVPTADGAGGVSWAAQTGAAGAFGIGAVSVASYLAPQSVKDIADYVCDGTADEVEINQALLDATRPGDGFGGTGRGKVQLLGHRFDIATPILMPPAVWLAGMGVGTQIRADSSWSGDYAIMLKVSDASHSCVSDLTIGREAQIVSPFGGIGYIGDATGSGYEIATGADSFQTIRNVLILKPSVNPAIKIGGPGGANGQRGTRIESCTIFNPQASGIVIDGGSDAKIRFCVVGGGDGDGYTLGGGNVIVIGCKAFYQGNHSGGQADVGFNVTSSRCSIWSCEAQDNGGYGFRFTGSYAHGGDLQADSNAAQDANAAGFYISSSASFSGLQAVDRNQSTLRQMRGIEFGGTPQVSLNAFVQVPSGTDHVVGSADANSEGWIVREGTTSVTL